MSLNRQHKFNNRKNTRFYIWFGELQEKNQNWKKIAQNLLKKMTNHGRFFAKPKKFWGDLKLIDECHQKIRVNPETEKWFEIIFVLENHERKTKTEKKLLKICSKNRTNHGRFFVKPKKFSGLLKLVDEFTLIFLSDIR